MAHRRPCIPVTINWSTPSGRDSPFSARFQPARRARPISPSAPPRRALAHPGAAALDELLGRAAGAENSAMTARVVAPDDDAAVLSPPIDSSALVGRPSQVRRDHHRGAVAFERGPELLTPIGAAMVDGRTGYRDGARRGSRMHCSCRGTLAAARTTACRSDVGCRAQRRRAASTAIVVVSSPYEATDRLLPPPEPNVAAISAREPPVHVSACTRNPRIGGILWVRSVTRAWRRWGGPCAGGDDSTGAGPVRRALR
jgi:hypothetical protein